MMEMQKNLPDFPQDFLVETEKMKIPPYPTITFRFNGLLVFCFDQANNRAQIGVQTTTSMENKHELRISLTKMAPLPVKTTPITLGHDYIRKSGDLFLEVVSPQAGTEGIQIHTSGRGVNRQTGDGDPHDIAWLPDLENEAEFYPGPLELEPGILTPCLNFNHGLFYTATITEDRVRKAVNGAVSDFGFVAEYVGANLYLTKNSQVILRLGEGGPPLATFDFQDNAAYLITVENTAAPTTLTRNHFSEYYSAVKLGDKEPIILEDPVVQTTSDEVHAETAESGSCTPPIMMGQRTRIK